MEELVDIGVLWDFEDPLGSENRFREAAEATQGAPAAILRSQVARALGLQERFDAGHAELDAIEASPPLHPETRVRVALERGRLLRSAGAVAASRSHFQAAAAAAEDAGLGGLQVDALHMLALTEATPEGQITANRAALEVAVVSPDPAARRWRASLLNNLGCALVDTGDLPAALTVFEEALEVREAQEEAQKSAQGEVRETQIARWMVGWTLRLLGRTADALALQRALKAELDAVGVVDPYVDEEIATLESGSGEPISPPNP